MGNHETIILIITCMEPSFQASTITVYKAPCKFKQQKNTLYTVILHAPKL